MSLSRTEQLKGLFERPAIRLPAPGCGLFVRGDECDLAGAVRSMVMCRFNQPAYDHTGREGPPSG